MRKKYERTSGCRHVFPEDPLFVVKLKLHCVVRDKWIPFGVGLKLDFSGGLLIGLCCKQVSTPHIFMAINMAFTFQISRPHVQDIVRPLPKAVAISVDESQAITLISDLH